MSQFLSMKFTSEIDGAPQPVPTAELELCEKRLIKPEGLRWVHDDVEIVFMTRPNSALAYGAEILSTRPPVSKSAWEKRNFATAEGYEFWSEARIYDYRPDEGAFKLIGLDGFEARYDDERLTHVTAALTYAEVRPVEVAEPDEHMLRLVA